MERQFGAGFHDDASSADSHAYATAAAAGLPPPTRGLHPFFANSRGRDGDSDTGSVWSSDEDVWGAEIGGVSIFSVAHSGSTVPIRTDMSSTTKTTRLSLPRPSPCPPVVTVQAKQAAPMARHLAWTRWRPCWIKNGTNLPNPLALHRHYLPSSPSGRTPHRPCKADMVRLYP